MNFDKNVTSLWDTHKKRLTWETKRVMIKVVSRPTARDENQFETNLIDTLKKVRRPKAKLEINDCWWLPSRFNANTKDFREKKLVPYFVNACIESGFNVMSKGCEGNVVRMVCNRGRSCSTRSELPTVSEDHEYSEDAADSGYISDSDIRFITGEYRPPVSIKEKKPVRRSYRPLKGAEEVCPFKFNVYFSEEHQRWYLPKQQAGDPMHCGHFQKEPEECKLSARHAGLDTLKIVESGFNACLRSAQITKLIEMLEGKKLNRKQVRDYIHQQASQRRCLR